MGEVDNRKVKAFFELLFNLFLAGIQVDMAVGAGNHDRGKAFLLMTERTLGPWGYQRNLPSRQNHRLD
jgi:hypothetical protein